MGEVALPLNVPSRRSRSSLSIRRLRELVAHSRERPGLMPAPCFGRMELKDEIVARGLALRAAVAEPGSEVGEGVDG